MTQAENDYNRLWMRKHRAIKAWQRSIEKGHCPVCEMLLESKYHTDCRFLHKQDKSTPF